MDDINVVGICTECHSKTINSEFCPDTDYAKTMKFAYLIEPPFNHRTTDGRITGTDVELARIVVNHFNLGNFEPIRTEFAELLPGVASGRWRMTTGLFATDERKQFASFSIPIWALPDRLLVATGNPKNLSVYLSIAKH